VLFDSYEFIFVFLPIVVLGHVALGAGGINVAAGWVTAASLAFYAWWNPAPLQVARATEFLDFQL
jgi:hypothetical protein